MLALSIALIAALAFETVYDISFRERPPDPLASAANPATSEARAPLELRMVDSGGVAIPLNS